MSKTKPSDLVRQAYESGLTAFGENYAQEMAEKARDLADLPLSWHFIGPIQSNKTAIIAKVSDWVHSVDRLKVARRLSEQRPPEKGPLNILLQVKTSGEDTKSGVLPEALPELIGAIAELPHLTLRGLMTIPAPKSTPAETIMKTPIGSGSPSGCCVTRSCHCKKSNQGWIRSRWACQATWRLPSRRAQP